MTRGSRGSSYELMKLSIMSLPEQELGGDRPHQGAQHIPVGVPDIALRRQIRIGRLSQQRRCCPFDELETRADREAHGTRQKEKPAAAKP